MKIYKITRQSYGINVRCLGCNNFWIKFRWYHSVRWYSWDIVFFKIQFFIADLKGPYA